MTANIGKNLKCSEFEFSFRDSTQHKVCRMQRNHLIRYIQVLNHVRFHMNRLNRAHHRLLMCPHNVSIGTIFSSLEFREFFYFLICQNPVKLQVSLRSSTCTILVGIHIFSMRKFVSKIEHCDICPLLLYRPIVNSEL